LTPVIARRELGEGTAKGLRCLFPPASVHVFARLKISLTLREQDFAWAGRIIGEENPMPNLEEAIRERAYHLWIADGQPEGRAEIYWLMLNTKFSRPQSKAWPALLPQLTWQRRELSEGQGSFGPEKAKLAQSSPLRSRFAGPDDAIMRGRGGSTSPLPLREMHAVRGRYTSKDL
jgi:hypothetical protein